MLRRTTLAMIAATGMLISAAAPANAQGAGGATGDPDLRCMLIASALGQNKDQQARTLSSLMVFYSLGRLDARRPGLNLRAALQAEARAVKPAEMQAVGQRCVATINDRAKLLQSLGSPAGATPAAPTAAPKTP